MKQNNFFRKKTSVIFLLFACIADGFALDYTISFTGSGANTSVDSTVVQNITKGISVTVPSGQVLYLKDAVTNVNNVSDNNQSVSLSPNPIKEVSTLSFYTPNKGNININISDITGRQIYSVTQNVEAGLSSFNVSLPKGIFFIHISGKGMNYNEKAVSYSTTTSQPSVSGISTQFKNFQKAKSSAGVVMLFNDGDVLQYNGSAGNNSTVITDSPTGDKTVNFEFVECKDANNNYYGISKIGDYYWMTSNLKATKFRNGDDVPNVTDANSWKYLYSPGWCEQNNDPNNGLIYGKLYNYYTIADSRNIAPPGWHVATQEEFANLVSHVSTHWGFIVSESKALAIKEGWKESLIEDTPGYQPWNNNFSGFYGKPGGDRGGFYNSTFFNLTEVAFWWTATDYINIMDAYYFYFTYDTGSTILSTGKKQYGMSLRCVKDY